MPHLTQIFLCLIQYLKTHDDFTEVIKFLDLRHRYAKDGRYHWFCISPEFKKYFTYEEAMNACLLNNHCEYVYESDCNDKGPFQLCPKSSGKGPSLSGCLYGRDGKYSILMQY